MESGTCVEKIQCPKCGSSNLQVFEKSDGSHDGYCFGECGSFFAHPYDGEVVRKDVKRKVIELYDPTKLPLHGGFRGIKKGALERYNVRTEVSESDGKTITKSYWPVEKSGKTCGWSVRDHNPSDPKEKILPSVGDRRGELEFFGQAVAKKNNGKKLFVTEGELDCVSLYQALIENTAEKYKHLKPSVVSLTRGAGSAVKDFLNNREFVESFDEIVLVFDMDKDGQKAVKDVMATFPLCKVAKLPLKDANEMLEAGRGRELYNEVMWNAKVERQGEVVQVSEIVDKALERPKYGVSTPWPTINRLTYGLRPHTIHILGASEKAGKSDFEYQLAHHLLFKEGQKVGLLDLEAPPAKTIKKIVSKEAKKDFTKPTCEYEDSELKQLMLKLDGKLFMYDRGASRDWTDIRIAIEEMHLLDNINFFFLDPLTALVSRYDASEANNILNEVSTDIADLVYKHPITLMCFSHLNPKAKGAKPHEAGGRVLTSEFTGSRGMSRYFHYAWGLRRDRSPECPLEEQDVSYVDLLFDREFGNSGTARLFYDKETVNYLEVGDHE